MRNAWYNNCDMNDLQSWAHNIIWLLLLAGVVWAGYWGVQSLQDEPSDKYVNEDAKTHTISIAIPTEDLQGPQPETEEETPEFLSPEFVPKPEEEQEASTAGDIAPEYAPLASLLEGLIKDKVYMKQGSRGTRVGTVQKFLNVYFETSNTVDNDYGPGTKSRVADFQKDVGISADGFAGPQTYQAMINWLAKQ